MLNFFKSRYRNNKAEEGFSMPELIITLIIIGIIAAIAIPIYVNQQIVAIKAQVNTDVASSVTALSKWQNNQSAYKALPTASQWNSILIRTDNQTNIVLKSEDWGDYEKRQFCVEGNKNINGSNYVYHFSLVQQKGGEGACPAFVEPLDENYS